MYTDLPLHRSEDDKLGRYIFATEIASGLVNSFRDNNESIVLGINGTWGSGKSTLINFIINEVERLTKENDEEIITVKFNPWMFSGQKELQNIFLKELFVKLESNKEKLKDASKKIADFLEHLNWLKYIHSGTGEVISDAKKLLEGFNKEKNLSDLKKDIDELLIRSKVKLYITIDDIDRLTPSEITDIFQLVKLNGNFANTIFILAYDQDVVTTALNHQFGENGKKYIEKIVQIDYTLPAISKIDITRIFIDSLNLLFTNEKIANKIKELNNTIKKEPFLNYFTSLRDIYRFNNAIKLRLPSIFYELNILDFFLIEALRIFDKEAYQFIINNKEILVYDKNEESEFFGIKQDKKNSTKKIIEDSKFNEQTKEVLSRLFVINYNDTYNIVSSEKLIREKRIANKNYFDRYFNLQLTNLDIQEETFDVFKKNDVKSNLILLKKIQENNQLSQFLRWLEIKSKNNTNEILKKLILSSLNYTNQLSFKTNFFFNLDFDLEAIYIFCSNILNKLKTIEHRREVVMEFLQEDNIHYSNFYLSNLIIKTKEDIDAEKITDNRCLCLFTRNDDKDKKFVESITLLRNDISKKIFNKLIIENDFLEEDEIFPILENVKINHSKLYDEKFHLLIEKDENLIKFLWLTMKKRYLSSTKGTGFQLAKKQFIPGLDPIKIKKRIDEMSIKELDENEKKIVKIFKKAYKDGFKEDIFYNIETQEIIDMD